MNAICTTCTLLYVCKESLMMVNWPKHVVKIKIKVKLYCVWLKQETVLLYFSLITRKDILYQKKSTLSVAYFAAKPVF